MDTGFPLLHCTATSGRKSEHISERALRVSNDVSIQVNITEWSFPTPSHASSAPSSPDVSGPVAGRENSSQSNNKGHTSINYWHERKIFKAVSWIYYQRGTDSRWKQGKPTMTETSIKILKKTHPISKNCHSGWNSSLCIFLHSCLWAEKPDDMLPVRWNQEGN